MGALRFGSLFAGIGGMDLGLERAGWRGTAQVEIDPRCREVLARHFPEARRHDDVTTADAGTIGAIDLLCGGFPCQDVSVAGRRAGLAGARSGLFHEFMRLAADLAPRWVLIENVPGLLSSNGGRDMGTVLGTLGQLGYGWAYRCLDAQYDGLAQRRERVFIVGCLGDAARAAAVLFEPASGGGNPPPRREAREGATGRAATGVDGGGWPAEVAPTVDSDGLRSQNQAWFSQGGGMFVPAVAGPLGGPSGEGGFRQDLDNHGAYIPMAFDERVITSPGNRSRVRPGDPAPALNGGGQVAVAFSENQRAETRLTDYARQLTTGGGKPGQGYPAVLAFTERTRADGRNLEAQEELAYALTNPGDGGRAQERNIVSGMAVRRLTPTECERLQGFPDGWTAYGADGTPQSDSTRYRMLGNAVAVPVVTWIGRRIIAAAGVT